MTVTAEMLRYLRTYHNKPAESVARWANSFRRDIDAGHAPTSAVDPFGGPQQQHSAAMAIWLGIMLDGIPESLVLGTIQSQSTISLSLIAGLFISNYPEALSSSIGMRHQGLEFPRILLMWSSLVVATGLGAAMGALFFGAASPASFAIIEGVAVGAMLTMIAQTMLPEAYIKGGNIIGLATLAGFLVALFFKELGGS